MILETCRENGKQLYAVFILRYGGAGVMTEKTMDTHWVSSMCQALDEYYLIFSHGSLRFCPRMWLQISPCYSPFQVKQKPCPSLSSELRRQDGGVSFTFSPSLVPTLGDLSCALSLPFYLSFLDILFGPAPLTSALHDPNPSASWSCSSRSPDHVCC